MQIMTDMTCDKDGPGLFQADILRTKFETAELTSSLEGNVNGAEGSKRDDLHYSLQMVQTGVLVWYF